MKYLTIIVMLIVCTPAWGELNTLYNNAGKNISAELLSLENDSVKIKKADGREFSVLLSEFDAKTQKLINDHFAQTSKEPEETSKAISKDELSVVFREKKLDRVKSEIPGSNGDVAQYREITIVEIQIDLKYSGDRKLENLVLKYNVIYNEQRMGSIAEEPLFTKGFLQSYARFTKGEPESLAF